MIQERFLLFETLQGFQDMYYRGAIQPTSIAFIKETGQIFAQNSFFAVDANAFKSLSLLAKVNRDYLNDILGIKGPSLEVIDISNLADLLYFTTGYEKGTQLKDLLEAIKDTLRLEIEDASNYLAELIDSLDYRTSLNEEDIEYIQEDISSINTDIEGLNYSLLELNNYVVKVDSLLTEAINNLSVELNNYKQEINNKIGKPNGFATLDENGIVPSSQLPSYVDDVLEYSSYSTLPTEGSTGIIYVTLDDNKTYRWSGSTYVEISKSLGLGETASTAFPGNRGVELENDLEAHVNSKNNPHKVTKEQLGLDKVDNTPDVEKDVNSAVKDSEGNIIKDTYVTNEWEKFSWDKKISIGRSQFEDKQDYIAIIKIKKRCVAEFLIGNHTPFAGCDLQRMIVRCTYSASVTTDSSSSIYYTNSNGTNMTIYRARTPNKEMYGNGGIMIKVLRILSADNAEPVTDNFDDYVEYYDDGNVLTRAPFQARTLTYRPPVVEEDTSATIINVTKSNLSSKNVPFDISDNTEFIVKTEDNASLPEGFKFTSSALDSVSSNTIIDFTFKSSAEGFILSNNGIDVIYEYPNKIYTGDVLSIYIPEEGGEWFATLKPAMIASETLEVTADEIGRTTVEYNSASTEISVVGEVLEDSEHSWCHTLFYLPFLDKGTKVQTVDIEWGVEHVTDSINAPWFGVTFASRLTTRRMRAGEQYVSGNTHVVKCSDLYPQGGELYEAEYLNYMYSKIQPQVYYQTSGNTSDTIKSEVFFRLWLDPQCFPATEENPLTMRVYVSSLIINGKRVNPRKVVFDDGTSRPYFLNGYSSLPGAIPLENYLDVLPKFKSSDNSVSIDYDYDSNTYNFKSAKKTTITSSTGTITVEDTEEGYDINIVGEDVTTYTISSIEEFIEVLDTIKERGGQDHRARIYVKDHIDIYQAPNLDSAKSYYNSSTKVFNVGKLLKNTEIIGIGKVYFCLGEPTGVYFDVDVSFGFSRIAKISNILFGFTSNATDLPKMFSRYMFELTAPDCQCIFEDCTFASGAIAKQKFMHISTGGSGYHISLTFNNCLISAHYNQPHESNFISLLSSGYNYIEIERGIEHYATFTFTNMIPVNVMGDTSIVALPKFYFDRYYNDTDDAKRRSVLISSDGTVEVLGGDVAKTTGDISINNLIVRGASKTESNSDYVLALNSENKVIQVPNNAGIATADKAGVVKSGGDITIQSDGTMQVKDDSHNHVIENVDGLQSALEGKRTLFEKVFAKNSVIKAQSIEGLFSAIFTIKGVNSDEFGAYLYSRYYYRFTYGYKLIELSKCQTCNIYLLDEDSLIFENKSTSNLRLGVITTTSNNLTISDLDAVPEDAVSPEISYVNNAISDRIGNIIDETYATKTENNNKVDKVSGKGLSTNDYTTADKDKLNNIEDGANNYTLPVADSSNLGGIKSGGDITIDSAGVVQVNDNSHNHSIDNISNLATRLNSKVDKIVGKGLSTNDYTTTEKDKLSGIANGAEVNIINTIKRNGVTLTPDSDKVINIEIPTKVSELNNDNKYQTAADVASSIVNIEYSVATGYFKSTMKDGSVKGFYLPIEKFVKDGHYDANTQELVFEIENGNEIRIDVKDLVNAIYSGDDTTIELINDNGTYKFKLKDSYKDKIDKAETTDNKTFTIGPTSTDNQYPSASTVWKAIKDFAYNVTNFTKASSRTELNSTDTVPTLFGKIAKWLSDLKTVAFTGSYSDLTNKPTIPTVGGGTITIKQKGVSKGSFTVNQSSNTTIELTDDNTTYGIGNASTAGLVKSDADSVEILSSGKMVARKADLATFADKGIKGTRIVKGNSSIKYVMLGAVGLDYNVNSTFSLTVEVHGAYSGSGSDCKSRLSIYNIVFRLVNDSVAGQIGCVYASDSINNAIIGEIVYPTATTDGMLYLWVNVSEISSQEAFNVCVYGDTNKIEIRQSVHAISIPYYSGVLLNPELHVNIATSTTPGLVKSGGDITIASDGVVSVNDNSHNHTIANVTGLQNALSEKLSTTGLANYARRLSPVVNQRNGTTTRYLEICRATVSRSANYVIYDASFIINGGDTARAISMQARIMGWKGSTYQLNEIILRVEQCSDAFAINRLCAEYVHPTANEDGMIVVYMDTETNNYWNYSIIPLGSPYDRFKFVQSNQVHLTQGVASLPANGGTVIKGSLKATATHDGSGNNIVNTYLKLAGGNMTGNVRKKEGDYVALIPSKQYSSYYLQFMKITYVGANLDVPVEIRLSGRGSHQYIIQVNNASGGLNNVTFYTTGNSIGTEMGVYYKYDSTAKTLSLMYHHSGGGGWEAAAVTDVIVPNNHYDKFTFDYTITEVVGASGWTKAGRTTFHYAISERANRDGNGNTITSYYAPKTELSKYLPLAGGTLTGAVTRTITNTKDTVIMPDKDGYGKIGGADNMFFKGYFDEVRVGTEIELDSGPRPDGDVEDGGRYYNNVISGGADGITIKAKNLELYKAKGSYAINLNMLGAYQSKKYSISAEGSSDAYTHRKMFTLYKNGGVRLTIFTTSWGPGISGVAEYIIWINETDGQNNNNLNIIRVGNSGSNMYPKYILNSDRSLVIYDEGSYYAFSYFYTIQPLTPETDFKIHTSASRSVVSGVTSLG